MTSSTIPSPRRPSAGASFESLSRRGWPSVIARSASRTTTGWAQLPPTQPSIVPSGWTIPAAPGRADVGRRTATTVATANVWPAPSSSAAREKMCPEVMALVRPRNQATNNIRIDRQLVHPRNQTAKLALPNGPMVLSTNQIVAVRATVRPVVRPMNRAPVRASGARNYLRLTLDRSLLVEGRPHLLRRDRDVDVADAEVPHRVDDRVRDCRRRPDRGRFADTLRAERVVR